MSTFSAAYRNKDQRINPVVAWIFIIGTAALVFLAGILIGKTIFWKEGGSLSALEKQLSVAQERVKQNPKNPSLLVNLGWVYFQKGDYNQSLAQYQKAIDIDRNYYPAHYNLGLAYMQVKKYNVAVEAFKKAISLENKSYTAHFNLGITYNLMNKPKEALKEFEISYKLNPGSVDIMYQMGQSYEKLGQKDNAKYMYKSALRYDPKYPEAKKALDRLEKVK